MAQRAQVPEKQFSLSVQLSGRELVEQIAGEEPSNILLWLLGLHGTEQTHLTLQISTSRV